MNQLINLITNELKNGKTPFEIKKSMRNSYSSMEISRAMHVALEIYKAEKYKPVETSVSEISEKHLDVNNVWLWATIASITAIVLLTAVWIYFSS